MSRTHVYALNLTKIEGKGDFSCPNCGNEMSPDDESEENYSIQEPKVNNFGLKELLIRCNKCASVIRLTGFSLLQKIANVDQEKI